MAEGGEERGRLVVKEMELENFKSYAGKQTVGPMHHSLSAIVGPNGSGKSNVIDALLFVFGKKAKQLRLSRVSELIHNADPNSRPDSASVSISFASVDSSVCIPKHPLPPLLLLLPSLSLFHCALLHSAGASFWLSAVSCNPLFSLLPHLYTPSHFALLSPIRLL